MLALRRPLQTAIRQYTTAAAPTAPVAAPVKKIGAFRGGFLGFLTGVSVTSAFVYGYVLDEYKTTNNVIIKDVLSLAKSIRVLEEHVTVLEKQSGQK